MSGVIDEIKARVDLVELIGRAVPLRKSGSSYKGLCPFHQEKTPSFYVTPTIGQWRCFGCDKGGSAFDWLMEHEHLDFGEALRALAQLTGVALPAQRDAEAEEAAARLAEALSQAQLFYQAMLQGTAGAAARRYLAGRDLSEDTAGRFGLGYAPPGNLLLRHLAERGFSGDELVAAGLVSVADDGHHFDFFRDRVLFPIRDQKGRTIAFGGRGLGDTTTPKYLNSRDTLLFHKHETLFALDLAREPIARERSAVVVEGYVDALMAHQHGYANVVATLGTAVTDKHLAVLRRLAEVIVLALDSDAAGQAATWRALQVAEQSLQVGARPVLGPNRRQTRYLPDRAAQLKVLRIPDAKDPDELIRADPGAWAALVRQAEPVVDFVLSQLPRRHDLTTAQGKSAAAAEAAEVLQAVANPIEQAHYVQRVAELLKVDEAAIRRTLRARRSPARLPRQDRDGQRGTPEPGGATPGPAPVPVDSLDEYALALLWRARDPDLAGYGLPATARAPDLPFSLPESRALLAPITHESLAGNGDQLRSAVPAALLPSLERVLRHLPDVSRFSTDQLAVELDRVRLRMQQRALLARQGQVRSLLRDATDTGEQLRWAQELSGLAHTLDSVEQALQQATPKVERAAP